MSIAIGPSGTSTRLSVVIPFHKNIAQLRRSLWALRTSVDSLPADVKLASLVVVADGATEDLTGLAAETGAEVVRIDGPRGPAVARNRGAAVSSGDVIVFVDADVVVSQTALAQFAEVFRAHPDVAAVFGAYDEDPAHPEFLSVARNLAHSFIHQRSPGEARTFWAGLGAVRASAFAAVGGFDERFTRPTVEDIDLGYRLRNAGFRILLEPPIQGKHLKRWTFRSSVVSDIRDRGIPWTQLLARYEMHDDLNVTVEYRACVAVAALMVMCTLASVRWPLLLVPAIAAIVALWLLDRPYYQFFARRRGLAFAIAWFPIHILHHLCNGLSFVIGMFLRQARRWTGLVLPGALPLDSWSVGTR
jgi:GT2 family glycosyltransferase